MKRSYLFFALAGWKHAAAKERNLTRSVAMISDVFIALLLAIYIIMMLIRLT